MWRLLAVRSNAPPSCAYFIYVKQFFVAPTESFGMLQLIL